MSETATAEYNRHIAALNVRHCPCVDRLGKERDDLKLAAEQFGGDAADARAQRDELVAEGIHREDKRWKVVVDLIAAQRDEGAGLLTARSKQNHVDQKHPFGSTAHIAWDNCGRQPCVADRTFLASLSTVTPEDCERVSVCCRASPPGDGSDHTCGNCNSQLAEFKCATHHGIWPSHTKRCPAAMVGNVTA